MAETNKERRVSVPIGFPLKGRWILVKRIGHGAFGDIYSALDILTDEEVAVKIEKATGKRQVLRLEVAVLAKLQGFSHICRLVDYGRTVDVNFLVMELLGKNLNELRKMRPSRRFSKVTSIKLAIEMLRSLEEMHKAGYIHRDVKPSNFVIGLHNKSNFVYIVDFGLSRRYKDANGNIKPPRESASFRGTARYASINSHDSQELGPRDDLWSLFYVIVEFLGRLPWANIKDKVETGEIKKKYHNYELVKDLPPQLWQIMRYLHSLEYSDEPIYRHIEMLLESLFRTENLDRSNPYDWDEEYLPSLASTISIDSLRNEGEENLKENKGVSTTNSNCQPISCSVDSQSPLNRSSKTNSQVFGSVEASLTHTSVSRTSSIVDPTEGPRPRPLSGSFNPVRNEQENELSSLRTQRQLAQSSNLDLRVEKPPPSFYYSMKADVWSALGKSRLKYHPFEQGSIEGANPFPRAEMQRYIDVKKEISNEIEMNENRYIGGVKELLKEEEVLAEKSAEGRDEEIAEDQTNTKDAKKKEPKKSKLLKNYDGAHVEDDGYEKRRFACRTSRCTII